MCNQGIFSLSLFLDEDIYLYYDGKEIPVCRLGQVEYFDKSDIKKEEFMDTKGYTFKVRGLMLGNGMPKICIPLVGKDENTVLEQAKKAIKEPCHLIEWRADWFEGVEEQDRLAALLDSLRKILGDLPLLFTFRTKGEGGEKAISWPDYRDLLLYVASTGRVDLIDLEAFFNEERTPEFVGQIKESGTGVILSNHDFAGTPSDEEMAGRLTLMQEMGADVVKLAVMPEGEYDVLRLMEVTREFHEVARVPVITMSMGRKGLLSRISGHLTGSCLSFGSAGQASAPGQIPAGELNRILTIIDERA